MSNPRTPATLGSFVRLDTDVLPHYTSSDRVAYLVGAEPESTARLFGEIAERTPSAPRRGRVWGVGTVAGVAMVASLIGGASGAQAAVLPVAPVRVVLSSPTTTVHFNVTATVPAGADGGFGIEVGRPSLHYGVVLGDAYSDGPQFQVAAPTPSADMPLGQERWEAMDDGDGRVTGVLVDVLRQSRVTLNPVVGVLGGLLVTGRVTHYDPQHNDYRGDQASPVQVQALESGRWVTVASTMTAPDGSVCTVVPLGQGRWTVRIVRSQGVNVSGATSSARVGVVPQQPAPLDI